MIYCLYKIKQSHWLLCVAKNCDCSRKITPLSNLTRKSLLVDESSLENQNWTAKSSSRKEIAGKAKQFLSLWQRYGPKSLDAALNIAGVEKLHTTDTQRHNFVRIWWISINFCPKIVLLIEVIQLWPPPIKDMVDHPHKLQGLLGGFK